MSEYYKMRPARWNTGTDDLTLEQEAAYLRVVNAIHLHDHPVRHNMRVLAGLWRCNERKAKRLLADLIEAGKLQIEGEWIINELAMEDLSIRRQLSVERSSSGRRGGIESGKTRAKSLKDNDHGQATGSTRIEENRIEENTPLPPEGEEAGEEGFDLEPEPPPHPKKKPRSKRPSGTRIPDGFPTEKEILWAVSAEGLSRYQADREAVNFRDYWLGRSGQQGVKLDWPATWRTRVRTAKDKGWLPPRDGPTRDSPRERFEQDADVNEAARRQFSLD